MIKFLLIALCIIFISKSIKVDTENTLFLDQYNRYTVYHGVNVVFKTQPFYPDLEHFSSNYSLTDMDLYNLRSWGFNMIRLHVAWEGAEPQKGEYNYTYIEKLREIVRKCNNYGIYVLLDSHQDLFSKKFCGEGFPDWAVTRTNFPFPVKTHMEFDEKGYPRREDCLKIQFALFYTSQDVMKFQEQFFTNQHGIFDHFIGMWKRVASYMSKQPNLLGYQIVNEPIGANVYRNPADVLLPGASNNKFLKPAYEKAYSAIRQVDPINLIFYEPSVLDPLGGGFYETLGNDQKQKERQVFSYHVYCPYVTPLGEPVNTKFCSVFDQLEVASKQMNTQSLKVGGFMTEYGALSNSQKSAEEVVILTDLMRSYFRSWSYWQFKYYNDITTAARPGTTQSFYNVDGSLQQTKVKALARPYAYAICGTPLFQKFKNGVYTLRWIPDRQCYNKNTELFLSEAFYFLAGFTPQFKNCPQCKLSKTPIDSYYEIIVPKQSNKKITLIISPVPLDKKSTKTQ